MTGRVVSILCAVMLLATTLTPPAAGQSPEPSPQPEPSSPPASEPLRMLDGRYSFTATPLPDGSVLVIGGSDGWSVLGSAETFDPATRRFSAVGVLEQPRFGHQATSLPDGRVLVTGGALEYSQGLSLVEVYDPETASFTALGRLAEQRFLHTATALDDGQVLITGGFVDLEDGRPTSSAELFDPATGTSSVVGEMHAARVGHAAVRLDDGRVVAIGSLAGTPGEGTMEVYDPDLQRFLAPRELAAAVSGPQAVRLDDGRVLAVSARSVVIAADAETSEPIERPDTGGMMTATSLDDGRVVVIGSGRDEGPALVEVFDPSNDTFSPADPMRLTRQGHVAVKLDDGNVLVLGGLGCMQVLDTAEIWDPDQMSAVAGGSESDCDPYAESTPPPLPKLGATTSGGRIEMPASAFAITVPDDWTVEIADPDTDVFTAEPGSAWEALRATSPDRTMACSVAVGVAEVALEEQSGTGSGGVGTPMWDPNEPGLLRVPSPVVEEGESSISMSMPMERLQREHEGLEHDAMYSIHCVGDSESAIERLGLSLEFLPQQ